VLAHALAAEGRPDAVETARGVIEDARRLGLPSVGALAMLAASRAEGTDSPWRQRADAVLDRAGLPRLATWAYPTRAKPSEAPSAPARPAAEAPPALLRCLGTFRLEVGGVPVDLASVKPRARSLLRLLSLHAPRPVHREVLAEALWPEADADAATRNLQVAISSLRQVLEPGVGRGSHTLLVRDGDAYRLALPEGSDSDLAAFADAIAASRGAGARGDTAAASDALRRALILYTAEVLPEEGPADWAVAVRDQVRSEAVDAATRLAELCLAADDAVGAVEACEQGLRADRYRDALWRLLGDAHRAAGDQAAAARTERDYAQVLSELGVE
jgi:DNA-binding SARP family transcriptional activator